MRPVRRARAGVLVALVALLLGSSAAFPAGAAIADRADHSDPWLRDRSRGRAAAAASSARRSPCRCDPSTPEPTLDLAVIRARARDADQRIGTLVINPGGPGVPAVRVPAQRGVDVAERRARPVRSRRLRPAGRGRERADRVRRQPRPGVRRGVPTGDRRGARCDSSTRSPPSRSSAQHATATCSRTSRPPTRSRDLEQLRVALGSDEAVVPRVLVRHLPRCELRGGTPRPRARLRARRSGRSVDVATAVTLARRAASSTHSTTSSPTARTHRGLRVPPRWRCRGRVRRRSAPRPARAPLASGDADGRGAQPDPLRRRRAAAALPRARRRGRRSPRRSHDAEEGDASTLLAGADAFVGRTDDGGDDHVLESFWAVTCLDGPVVGRRRRRRRPGAARRSRSAPRLGAFIVNNSLPCSVWPVPPVGAGGAAHRGGCATDPGRSAPRVTRRRRWRRRARAGGARPGSAPRRRGRAAHRFNNGNDCVDRAVTRYLVDARAARDARHAVLTDVTPSGSPRSVRRASAGPSARRSPRTSCGRASVPGARSGRRPRTRGAGSSGSTRRTAAGSRRCPRPPSSKRRIPK